METVAILDRDHLARYTFGDAALEQEVLGLFIGQMPITLATLRASEDAHAWERAAHTIKGSARAVGAWRLAEAAALAESSAGAVDRWAQLISDIEAAVADVQQKIEECVSAGTVEAA